ncbi:Hypothetical predicted protein [Paramuricea clavata]|uniref:Uncharacterized protein n=1 Tax=Paramuricea clavata TaxID=317549 RepID=A0A6S7J633_PARCT|nr:Hypothetical predicted protein [Paramuricea clavata]
MSNVFSVGGFHFWLRDVKLDDQDECSNWSTQAVKGDSECDMENDIEDEEKEEKKEPPCRYHPTLGGFREFQKEDEKQLEIMRDYVKKNRADFCDSCGVNVNFFKELMASHYYEALVISELDCEIFGSKRGKICDVYAHKRYHEKNCLEKQN